MLFRSIQINISGLQNIHSNNSSPHSNNKSIIMKNIPSSKHQLLNKPPPKNLDKLCSVIFILSLFLINKYIIYLLNIMLRKVEWLQNLSFLVVFCYSLFNTGAKLVSLKKVFALYKYNTSSTFSFFISSSISS